MALGVTLYRSIGTRQLRSSASDLPTLGEGAAVEVRNGQVLRLRGQRRDFSVEFGRQVTYQDGRAVMGDVTVRADNRGGRSFTVTAQEAEVGSDQSSVLLSGAVVLTASDGFTARGDRATYQQNDGMVEAPGAVTFSRGRMEGRGIGFRFDQARDTAWLLDEARVHMAAENGQGEFDIAAGAAGEARRERYLRFERSVTLMRDGQTIEADEATVYLLADRDEPDLIELRGQARIVGSAGLGALRAMRAEAINLDYGADGRTLEQAVLEGRASLTLAGADGGTGQRLSAGRIDVRLSADGSVSRLNAAGEVDARVPGVGGGPTRTIRAAELVAIGEPGRGMTGMRFTGAVQFREGEATGGPTARTARARQLDLVLSDTGEPATAQFIGDAEFDDGDLHGSGGEAAYDIADGRLTLTGRGGGLPSRVADPAVTVEADQVSVALATRQMTATGHVHTLLQPGRRPEGRTAARTPALLDASQPVFITADAMQYDGDAGRGAYDGQVRLWQGETAIQTDRLTMDEGTGDLRATGNVRSTLALGGTDDSAPPSIARAAEFRYDDAARRATYTTGAQLTGPQGELRADRIELLLAAGSRQLERLDGYAAVTMRVDRRVAKGTRLTYFAADERYLMNGTPVQMVEGCRETAGRTLTFFRTADRILIDGNEEKRTQTKGGGTCPDAPRPQ